MFFKTINGKYSKKERKMENAMLWKIYKKIVAKFFRKLFSFSEEIIFFILKLL